MADPTPSESVTIRRTIRSRDLSLSPAQRLFALRDRDESQPLVAQPEQESAPCVDVADLDQRYAARALAEEISTLLSTTEGKRNDQLNIAAFKLGTLVGGGHLDRRDVEERLRAAALHIGLTEAETEATLRSGMSAGIAKPRTVPKRADASRIEEVSAEDLTGSQIASEELWSARPLLAHIHRFARARMVAPWAVLGVTLARIVAATPYGVHLPAIVGGTGSLNLFVGLVGASGTGKGAASAVSHDAMGLGLAEARAERIASGEAIAHVYKRIPRNGDPVWRDDEHAVLIEVSEIDRLTGQSQRQGSTIMADLRSAWSGERLGQIAADRSRSVPIEAGRYRLCLVAGIQPHRAGALLDDADGGTPQRFVWLPATDPRAPDDPPEAPARMELELPTIRGDQALRVCDLARSEIVAARLAQNRGEADALDAHAMFARLKVGAALAIADGRADIDEDDWHLASTIAACSAATRAGVVEAMSRRRRESNRARGEADAERAAIIEERTVQAAEQRVGRTLLRRLGPEWTARKELRTGLLHSADRAYFDVVIERLIETGAVEMDEGGQRGSTRYRRL